MKKAAKFKIDQMGNCATQYPYTCRNCGKTGFSSHHKDFCSTRCNKTYLQRKYRAGTRDTCIHRANVMCADKSGCPTCGWNPKVEKARKERLRG